MPVDMAFLKPNQKKTKTIKLIKKTKKGSDYLHAAPFEMPI